STSLNEGRRSNTVSGASSLTLTGGMPMVVGLSLTALTVIEAVSVAVEKAVVVPLTVVSAVFPLVPLVWSQALNVMPGSTVPLKFRLGRKRTRVLAFAASNLAVVPF